MDFYIELYVRTFMCWKASVDILSPYETRILNIDKFIPIIKYVCFCAYVAYEIADQTNHDLSVRFSYHYWIWSLKI